MQVATHSTLEPTDEEYWQVYQRAFEDLRAVAAQRHLMIRSEFDELIADDRVLKFVVRDEQLGRIAALATMTNDLSAVPLISPEYFARQWPQPFARRKLWYVPFVGVDPDYQGTGAMGAIIGRMCEQPGQVGGVICVDICQDVEQRLRLPQAIERIARTYAPGLARTRLDAQVFWGYEFPIPA